MNLGSSTNTGGNVAPPFAPPRQPPQTVSSNHPAPPLAPQRPGAGTPQPNGQTLQLYIGQRQLINWEVPDGLPHLFGVKKMAIHDFPGGARTVQQLGLFPFPEIEWHGKLWNSDAIPGMTAMDRATQLNQLRTTQQPANLVWGQFNYTVLVKEFEIIGRLKQLLEYRISVVPIKDNTTTSNAQDPQSAEQILANALAQLNQTTNAPASGATLPSNISSTSNSIIAQINAAMVAANQTLAVVPQATITSIQNQIINLQALLPAYINGLQFALASATSDLNGALTATYDALGQVLQSIMRQVTVNNPNLLTLASEYYGDQGLWPLIANYNNLQDYQLTGTYTLVIPSPQASSPFVTS